MCSSLDSLFKAEKMESLRRVIALRREDADLVFIKEMEEPNQ